MRKTRKTNREKIASMTAKGLPKSVIAKRLGVTRQAVYQLNQPLKPRACACGTCGLFVVGKSIRYNPDCPNRDLARRCRCGCGAVLIEPRIQYIPEHKPVSVRLCRCGCGNVVSGKYQQYLEGHKPAKGDDE